MSEAAESNQAFIDFWKNVYPQLPLGEYRELPGLTAVWGDAVLPFCNAILLSHPVNDARDLEARVTVLQAFLSTKSKPPMVLLCQDWLPDSVRPIVDFTFARAGLQPAIPLRGMVAEKLLPTARRCPELEYARVSDQETRNLISDINSVAYGFAIEHGRAAFTSPEAWPADCYGYVAFRKGKPVAAASTSVLNGSLGRSLYVGFVATMPDAQRQGYAEAVMRHSLRQATEATGCQRSLLHATDAGHPIYLRMGYRDTASFMGYIRV
jgi:GNAT superfamily N-acetyltransferase